MNGPGPELEAPRVPAFYRDLVSGYVLLGLLPVFVSVLCATRLDARQVVFLRFGLNAGGIALLCLLRRRWITTKQPLFWVLRGALGACAVYFYFSAVSEVGAARATLLNYTYPFWANLFSVLFGARPSRRFWMGLGVAFLGVTVIVLPSSLSGLVDFRTGDLKGLLSAVLAGGSVLVVKQLRKTDESLSIVFVFSLGGLVLSWGNSSRSEALAVLVDPTLFWAAWGVGLSSLLGHVLFTRGYKEATVQQATVLSLLVPLVAALAGIAMLDEPLGLRFVVGAFLILSALVFVARQRTPEAAV